jgi:DNA-binding NarL/FixJ family response regulator
MTRILIVEDHRVVATGLEIGLAAEGFEVRSCDGAPEATLAACEEFDPQIVLLDLNLGEHGSGIDILPALRAGERTVIVLTGMTDEADLANAYAAGADVVIDKTIRFPKLVDELKSVHEGRSVEADNRRHEVLHAFRLSQQERTRRLAPFSHLTPREQDVLAMLIDGRQATAIAEASFVSLSTVRSQIGSILSKLGVSSQLTAVSMAIKAGWAQSREDLPSPPAS